MRFSSLFWALPALLVACGDKGAVSLTPYIPEAEVSLQATAFGAALAGSFKLELALGSEASGSTTVSLGNFSLQSANGEALVEVLKIETQTVFPVTVEKGALESATFTFEEGSVDRDAVCAGQVRVVGAVIDSLKGGTAPVQSALLTPTCGPII